MDAEELERVSGGRIVDPNDTWGTGGLVWLRCSMPDTTHSAITGHRGICRGGVYWLIAIVCGRGFYIGKIYKLL